ncbi:MAG TPA: Crp/Fnr family transcriptional regulator [Steroidobacteraceae bacterium]|nr:Crp/Fnr family transcriptional regulator [Steroidobacteraceae bacterium]
MKADSSFVTAPPCNHLLVALPVDALERLRPHLRRVRLEPGEILHDTGRTLVDAVFPATAIVSLLSVLQDGASAQVAVIGNDGVVGAALFLGGDTMPNRAVVQSAGSGYRLNAALLMEEFRRAGALHDLLLRYTQALLTQMAQTAVCNRHHSVDQQLCRWLLLSLDRLPDNRLAMTQELIASMLGVRREGVTEAAGRLQRAGSIAYRRGHIVIKNRAALEGMVCECYDLVRSEVTRLFPDRARPKF